VDRRNHFILICRYRAAIRGLNGAGLPGPDSGTQLVRQSIFERADPSSEGCDLITGVMPRRQAERDWGESKRRRGIRGEIENL